MKSAIVVTSIHDCTELLSGYLANFAKYGREAEIYLIVDDKTPRLELPVGVRCFAMHSQNEFLTRIRYPIDDIPRNSDNRRNVGYLMALADGAEMIVSIDDDNYCPENEDFIEEHGSKLGYKPPSALSAQSGWFNNISMLGHGSHYPRGFPYSIRTYSDTHWIKNKSAVRVNAGMWKGDPDLDAIGWLNNSFRAVTCHHCSRGIALAPDTWCPINSQNTAVHRDLMPAYYFIRMIPPNDRFGDIFQGYFALKVAKHMGWTARFGSPIVTHRRNSHVFLKDVQKEIEPILLLEELLPKLIEHKLTGTTVHEAYLSLADFIESQDTDFYLGTARLMRQWAQTCRRIG